MESLEHINALTLVFAALCIFAIAYRVYGIFLANNCCSAISVCDVLLPAPPSL